MSTFTRLDLSVLDAAYLAGLIDGEGSIAISRTRTNSSAKACRRGFAYRSSLKVVLTDLPLLEWARHTTGVGNICAKKVNTAKHRPAWEWSVWSNEAASVLSTLLPYLRLKQKQAENLIAFQAEMRQPGARGLSDTEWASREAHYCKSQTLNQRGASL